MSIFAKKSDPEQGSKVGSKVGSKAGSWGAENPAAVGPGRPYGIAEAIHLLRSLPTDQNSELIVRVVRTTLESLNVHLADIIDDAARKQLQTEERIAAVQSQVSDLERQLETLRHEIVGLEADLKETTDVKERLEMADKAGGGAHPARESGQTLGYGQHGPPPVPRGARSSG
ncbi:MAG TPA: hypothetical protein VFH68_10105 [Polyangia bacterium]|jgi:chaperonin cofactor prefoldin|nr:hypothetical protein [Polyangia bacterium]